MMGLKMRSCPPPGQGWKALWMTAPQRHLQQTPKQAAFLIVIIFHRGLSQYASL
jgi:hypothetical protein